MSIVTSGWVIDAVLFETLALHIIMNGLHRIRILFQDLQYDHLIPALAILMPNWRWRWATGEKQPGHKNKW